MWFPKLGAEAEPRRSVRGAGSLRGSLCAVCVREPAGRRRTGSQVVGMYLLYQEIRKNQSHAGKRWPCWRGAGLPGPAKAGEMAKSSGKQWKRREFYAVSLVGALALV